MVKTNKKVVVVIPNWNGERALQGCIDSLQAQSLQPHIILVDNGSVDGSVSLVERHYPEVEIIRHSKNKGYAGGVNPGFQRAVELNATYAAPFNNDAIADSAWLEKLVQYMDAHPETGIAAPKLLDATGGHIDSTGDLYTDWGLPYPRGRGESEVGAYDTRTELFGASGGASLYRVRMLQEIGFFDEDFFAYYEDVDLSFRAQLTGWKIAYVPAAVVYHEMSVTGKRIKGFFTYNTVKNLPWLMWKNVPGRLLVSILPRLTLAHTLFIGRALLRGHVWWAFKGLLVSALLLPKKLVERRRIQKRRTVTAQYIWDMMTHDLPPNAYNLRRLRALWWKVIGRKVI